MRDILKTFILSLDKTTTISKSKTTDSIYYDLLDIKIRYSNHFGTNDDKYDICILRPLNTNSYMVKIKQSQNILILPLKEVKSYIQSQFYFKTLVIKQHEALEKANSFKDKMFDKTTDWSEFANLLANRSKRYRNFTPEQKRVLKLYFENKIKGEGFFNF